jgi:hypothetical protein
MLSMYIIHNPQVAREEGCVNLMESWPSSHRIRIFVGKLISHSTHFVGKYYFIFSDIRASGSLMPKWKKKYAWACQTRVSWQSTCMWRRMNFSHRRLIMTSGQDTIEPHAYMTSFQPKRHTGECTSVRVTVILPRPGSWFLYTQLNLSWQCRNIGSATC